MSIDPKFVESRLTSLKYLHEKRKHENDVARARRFVILPVGRRARSFNERYKVYHNDACNAVSCVITFAKQPSHAYRILIAFCRPQVCANGK